MKKIFVVPLLIVLIVIVGSTAYAQDGKSNSVPLMPDDGVDNIDAASNPGCVGSTDNPHNSTHVPGKVNVVGKTDCAVTVTTLHVDTTLYEERCFLGWCWWAQAIPGAVTKNNVSLVKTNSSTGCDTTRYYGFSNHWAVYQGSYFSGTSQSDIITISSC